MRNKNQQPASHHVIIDAEVLRNIRQHARSELETEICGVLIGPGDKNQSRVIASIQGIAADQAGTHVTFTQDTWQHIYEVKDREYPDERIIGWYHSHPGFGVFLSDHDTFIHRNFFSAPEQIAWVFDPVSDEEGCFVWQGKEIRRAENITVSDPKGGENTDERSEPALSEVSTTKSSNRVVIEQEEEPGMSYLGWTVTVLSYIAVFSLGVLLMFFLAPRPERVYVPVPVDPMTGQPLDPRFRLEQPDGTPYAPGGMTGSQQAPSATQPPASGSEPRKDPSGKR